MQPEQHGKDWVARLVALIFVLVIMASLADALAEMVAPWLPLLLVVGIGGGLGWLAIERRNRW